MEKRHPHADATYRVVPHAETAFGVEIAIPEMLPTTVTSFASAAAAEAWIEGHKQRAQGGVSLNRTRWMKKR